MHLQIVRLQYHPTGAFDSYTTDKVTVTDFPTLIKRGADIISKIPEAERSNLFYTVAVHSGTQESLRPIRKAASFLYQTVLAWDIDSLHPDDQERWPEYQEVLAGIIKCEPKDVTVISTGNGLHLIVQLKQYIRNTDYFKDNKPHYNGICERIDTALRLENLSGSVDRVIFEPARILRLPGSFNAKPDRPVLPCVLRHYSDTQLVLNLQELSGLGDLSRLNIPIKEVKTQYPRPDFKTIAEECDFVRWAIDKPEEIHEPDAFDVFGLLSVMPPEAKIVIGEDTKTPRETALHIFENASGSRSLAREVFDKKYDNASRYGVRKCETINNRWGKCQGCKHFGKISCPLAIKSSEHISSEANGFWIISQKGTRKPHYMDLIRVYNRDKTAVVRTNGELFVFTGKQWENVPEGMLKHWVQKTMDPPEMLVDSHRVEFVKTVQAEKQISPAEETALFDTSIKGKINTATGILDVRTGELIPHQAQYGFLSMLPHEYIPGRFSEKFFDWLEIVTLQRADLIEAILDTMAYCLWPDYTDHVFTILTGTGKNGKSTLMHILKAIVGKQNVAAISMNQLTGNRFAMADLDGKMINMSEESSGKELSFEQINQLKNLSSGGDIYIEKKGIQGYTTQAKAKLIFSVNRMPRFMEQDEALKRRLLVIPFDFKIERPDQTVEDELIAEAPAILSMLIDRIQMKLKEEGTMRVSRGGIVGAQELRKAVLAGSSVFAFVEDCLDIVPEDSSKYVPVDELYASYLSWCAKSGISKPYNKISFGRTLTEFFVPWPSHTIKIGGKTKRILSHVSMKE